MDPLGGLDVWNCEAARRHRREPEASEELEHDTAFSASGSP